MTFDDYLKIDAVNMSSLKLLADKTPKHYRHKIDHPEEDERTPAKAFGSALHCAVLEPAEFDSRFAIWSGPQLPEDFALWDGGDRRGKMWTAFKEANDHREILTQKEVDAIESAGDAKKGNAWADFKEANKGRDILTEAERDAVLECAAAVRANPQIAPYLEGPGDFERTIQWTDPETGIACKGRVDRLQHRGRFGRVLVDLKSTRDAEMRVFGKQAANLGYHRALAFYADGLAAIGEPADKVAILLVESAPPYDCGVLVLDGGTLALGRAECRDLLGKLRGCLDSDLWPGRYLCEEALDLPEWARPDIDGDDDGADFDMEDM